MKVLMVWDGDYPWDVRVEKVCKVLLKDGHQVHLVCRNSNAKARREIDKDGLRVRRVYAFRGALAKLNSAITFPAFFSPLWLHEVRLAIKDVAPDLIIIRDLPIALAVVPWAKIFKIPMILDMAECYPEMIRCAWKFDPFKWTNIFVRNPLLADIVEKITIKSVTKIWVMIEESAQRLMKKGVPTDRICIVSNTPSVEGFSQREVQKSAITLRVVYTGLVNSSRGLATVVEAADHLKKRGFRFKVTIVGSGKDYPRISAMVRRLDVQDVVDMVGWINHSELGEILSNSDVGLVPHYSCSHWENTIPNKIFDYMKAGLPVIVSDVKPIARIVESTNCGLVYKSGCSRELAEKLIMISNETLRVELGLNGYNAVIDRYNWENDARVLLSSAKSVAGI